ncbi:hypothetical protein VSQ78_24855 [Nocardiopsis alba]|uniref:Uncharacterized protein n=1 Tax=Nocardiopsis alba TaxID=53437 RepID=A0ABV5E291_9ACTN
MTTDNRYHANGRYVDAVNIDGHEATADDRADEAVKRAHSVLPRIRAFAGRFPEVQEHANAVESAADRAEAFEDARDEARAAVYAAKNARDNAERDAIRAGKAPADTPAVKKAEKALAEARDKAEAAQRHREMAATEAGRAAQRAETALKRILKENADGILRERLVALDEARERAIRLAAEARAAMGAVYSHVLFAREAANWDSDTELSQLVTTEFHPDNVARGSDLPSFAMLASSLDTVETRLSYKDRGPFSNLPSPLGEKLGKAVMVARDDVAANE